jgi:hypothetical protein
MALGSTQPLTEMNSKNSSGDKRRPEREDENLASPLSVSQLLTECGSPRCLTARVHRLLLGQSRLFILQNCRCGTYPSLPPDAFSSHVDVSVWFDTVQTVSACGQMPPRRYQLPTRLKGMTTHKTTLWSLVAVSDHRRAHW